MKNVFIKIITLSMVVTLFFGCRKEEGHSPLVISSKVPQNVSNIKVENLPGAAKLTYTLPNDADVLYVVANYTLPNGDAKEVKSSSFTNSMLIEGFADERDYQVSVSVVTRAEQKSAPTSVTVHPLKAPINAVKETFKATETFGGITTTFTNQFNTEFVLTTLVKNASGAWIEKDRYYTSNPSVYYPIRRPEFTATPTDFAFYFTDKWKNVSDTIYTTLTPLFEEQFDKSLWKDADLTDDSNDPFWWGGIDQLWKPGVNAFYYADLYKPKTLPLWFTVDLGRKYRFSRVVVNQLAHNPPNFMYVEGAPEIFEIYGSNEAITDWAKWSLLGKFQILKPSGLPLGAALTAEDIAQAVKGHEFTFPPNDVPFRYIRFKILKTFGNDANWFMSELTFFGARTQ